MKPRYADAAALDYPEALKQFEVALASYPKLTDPRLHDVYLRRARLRWRVGFPTVGVLADLRSAAMCLDGEAAVRLYKLEPHRLRTRRIDPLHLAAVHPDPDMLERFGGDYGLPLATWYADAAAHSLEAELRVLSSVFGRARRAAHLQQAMQTTTPVEMVGLAAATYSAGFGYLAAGDTGSAAAVLTTLSQASNALDAAPPEAAKRYLRQCAAVASLLAKDEAQFLDDVLALVPDVTHGADAPDLVIPALIGLAMLNNVEPDLSELREHCVLTWSLALAVQEAWLQIE